MCPARQSGPYYEQPAGYHAYYSEEDALVYRDLQRTGLQEDMPEEDRAGPVDRSARPPNNPPPKYEEALHSLGRAPTVADLGPHSPNSCSSSLVPYEAEEDSNPEEDQNQQEVTPDQMETEELVMVEAPAKKGMGIAVGPGEYQLASPRYVRANEDSKDDKDIDEAEDIEAPYLAPKQNPTLKTPQDEQTAPTLPKGKFASAKDSQVSSGDESIPELVDLREEEEVPPPSSPKKANCPTTLGLHKKIAVTTEKPPVFPFPPPKENAETLLVAAPGVHTEEVPKEQVTYIDNDADPSPLSLLERQVDRLLMPPPTGPTPIAQKAPMSPKRGHQLLRVPEKRRHSLGTTGKKTLQER